MLGIASAKKHPSKNTRSYSKNRERGETPKQKHSLLQQDYDSGRKE